MLLRITGPWKASHNGPSMITPRIKLLRPIIAAMIFICAVTACQPKVQVVAPDTPININLNVKIDHEVRIKVDKELDQVISEKSELF